MEFPNQNNGLDNQKMRAICPKEEKMNLKTPLRISVFKKTREKTEKLGRKFT